MSKQYRYRLATSGIGPGGQIVEGFTSYITDDATLTPSMIIDNAKLAMDQNPENYPLTSIEIRLDFGEQRADFGDFSEFRGGNFIAGGGAALSSSGLSGTVLNRVALPG